MTSELEKALKAEAQIAGINNGTITFNVDINKH
jgi:indole-3-glycerol phosphate synthase